MILHCKMMGNTVNLENQKNKFIKNKPIEFYFFAVYCYDMHKELFL